MALFHTKLRSGAAVGFCQATGPPELGRRVGRPFVGQRICDHCGRILAAGTGVVSLGLYGILAG